MTTPLSYRTNLLRVSSRINKVHTVRDSSSPIPCSIPPSETQNPPEIIPSLHTSDGTHTDLCLSKTSNPVLSGAEIIQEVREVDLMVKLFTFISRLNKNQLRKTCKHWNRRLSVKKAELLYRAFFDAAQLKLEGKNTVASLDDNTGCPSFSDFLDVAEREFMEWKHPPSDNVMKKALVDARDRLDNPEGTEVENRDCSGGTAALNFTHSEFARIILLIRDDEGARSEMYALTQELTRQAFDSGRSRETNWQMISDRFNDLSIEIRFDFSGNIDDVDPSTAPLCQRSGTVLKDQFRKASTEFTRAYNRWMKSGQNDPTMFTDFLRYNNGQMYASSKRAHILFICCRLGTPYESKFLVDSATKMIMEGGCEDGIRDENRRQTMNGQDSGTTEVKRRRKGSGSLLDEVGESMSKSVIELGSVVNSILQNDKFGASATSRGVRSALDKLREEEECYKRVEETYDALQRAEDLGEPRILRFATLRHEKAIDEYEKLMAMKSQ